MMCSELRARRWLAAAEPPSCPGCSIPWCLRQVLLGAAWSELWCFNPGTLFLSRDISAFFPNSREKKLTGSFTSQSAFFHVQYKHVAHLLPYPVQTYCLLPYPVQTYPVQTYCLLVQTDEVVLNNMVPSTWTKRPRTAVFATAGSNALTAERRSRRRRRGLPRVRRVLLKSAHDYFQKPSCPHVFCKSCLSGWIEVKLAENGPDIRCPERGCRCALHADDVGHGRSPELIISPPPWPTGKHL